MSVKTPASNPEKEKSSTLKDPPQVSLEERFDNLSRVIEDNKTYVNRMIELQNNELGSFWKDSRDQMSTMIEESERRSLASPKSTNFDVQSRTGSNAVVYALIT